VNRAAVLSALRRENPPNQPVLGTGTSIVCQELMEATGVCFPDAHLDSQKMARLALAGHSVLGLDMVMPLFSVCHEAAAMGCDVNWGGPDAMPESGKPIFGGLDDIRVPDDLLDRPGCKTPLEAIRLLRQWLGDDAAVCGKVFGPWTQSYHYFGVENFLMLTLDDPSAVRAIMDRLLPVTIAFARAQIDAGADLLLLADHATRDLCGPQAYEQFLMDVHSRLAREIEVPLVLHICGDTSDRIGMIAQTGLAGFHWDTKTGSASKVRQLAGDSLSLMGGVSNYTLLRGTADEIEHQTREAVAAGIDIVGPECAIPLYTPLANLKSIASTLRPNA